MFNRNGIASPRLYVGARNDTIMSFHPQKIILPFDQPETDEDSAFFSSLKRAADGAGFIPADEGQLLLDVVETDDELIITAAMAGTPRENIELHLHNDLLTIRGERLSPLSPTAACHHRECYWGKFSRSVVLPVEVMAEGAQAEYRNGLLIVRLPKARLDRSIPIALVEE